MAGYASRPAPGSTCTIGLMRYRSSTVGCLWLVGALANQVYLAHRPKPGPPSRWLRTLNCRRRLLHLCSSAALCQPSPCRPSLIHLARPVRKGANECRMLKAAWQFRTQLCPGKWGSDWRTSVEVLASSESTTKTAAQTSI
jgi:hypothetical protein